MTELMNCRHCSCKLNTVLDLGFMYPSGFIKPDSTEEYKQTKVVLKKCTSCGLVQLGDFIELDKMYRQYWYMSSLNKSMVRDLQDVVSDIENTIELDTDDVVVDVGCNDGTMLEMYKDKDKLLRVGFDPAYNITHIKEDARTYFINDYFASEDYFEITNKKAKVITAIAMFYDLPNPLMFAADIKNILKSDGIFVLQLTDLYSMFKVNAFDNICAEHLEYYTLSWLDTFFSLLGMEIFKVSYNKVNGGSVRIFVQNKDFGNYNVSNSVIRAIEEEYDYFEDVSFGDFYMKILYIREVVLKYLKSCTNPYVLGASTKGNTLLQFFKLTNKHLKYALEVNKEKFGLLTLGSNIEIVSQDILQKADLPDCLLVLPWHFKDNFIKNKLIKYYLEEGGKLLFPMPEPHVVYIQDGDIKEKYL